MRRYAMTIAYDGTGFHGWQKQHPPDSDPLRTVQEVVEAAVQEVVREPVHVLGASRTDSGVHAEGQVASFLSPREFNPEILPAAITSRLPDDVQVKSAWETDPAFNPIGDAVSKGYRYRIAHARNTADLRPLFDRHVTAWSPNHLDLEAMKEAAAHLVGEHDFAAFTRVRQTRESTVRTIFDCTVEAEDDDRLAIHVSGNGFLWNMVRIVAGTLVGVGEARYKPEDIPDMIASGDRQRTGRTMPPEGLCLMWIEYGEPGSGRARQKQATADAAIADQSENGPSE
ncbi:MAG: tRNA pseudouridine(38-40) synthase TruA [Phycisphaerae bacterium]|nr:tRNA pseudouridine(38-40) synthase TruA [Phycisphaerae bacterium]|tara:strand:+ start:1034 stop:1885 length:852 start_codon:yes stop_codon:yes gene_type:complete